jgi:hypothetical protein
MEYCIKSEFQDVRHVRDAHLFLLIPSARFPFVGLSSTSTVAIDITEHQSGAEHLC